MLVVDNKLKFLIQVSKSRSTSVKLSQPLLNTWSPIDSSKKWQPSQKQSRKYFNQAFDSQNCQDKAPISKVFGYMATVHTCSRNFLFHDFLYLELLVIRNQKVEMPFSYLSEYIALSINSVNKGTTSHSLGSEITRGGCIHNEVLNLLDSFVFVDNKLLCSSRWKATNLWL